MLSGATVPAHASAYVVENCGGERIASIPLTDRDGMQGATTEGVLRADVYQSEFRGGTTCVMTVAGGADSEPIPLIAMIVTEDGDAVTDHGEYGFHAAVAATGTAGSCVLVYAAAELCPFGKQAPTSTGDAYTLPGNKRSYCV